MYMSDPLRTTDNADDRVHGRPSIFNTGATVLLSVALAVTSSLVAVELKYASPSALTVSQCVPGVPCIARRSADDGSCPAADSDTLAMLLQAPPVEKGTSTLSSCSSICPESGEYYDDLFHHYKKPEKKQVALFECRMYTKGEDVKSEDYCVDYITTEATPVAEDYYAEDTY